MWHVLSKYNREGNATFSERPTTSAVGAGADSSVRCCCCCFCSCCFVLFVCVTLAASTCDAVFLHCTAARPDLELASEKYSLPMLSLTHPFAGNTRIFTYLYHLCSISPKALAAICSVARCWHHFRFEHLAIRICRSAADIFSDVCMFMCTCTCMCMCMWVVSTK